MVAADYPILALLNEAKWWEKKVIVLNRSADNFYDVGITPHSVSGRYLQDFRDTDELEHWLSCALDDRESGSSSQ